MTQVSRKDYRVILDTLTALDCARSLTAAIMWRYGQVEDILNLVFDPLDYNDVQQARASYCATELIRKNRCLEVESIDRKAVALEQFFIAEGVCKETNDRLLQGNPDYNGILHAVARKIDRILGPFCPSELLNRSGWGPGVTLTLKTGQNSLFRKFRHDGEVTPKFYNTCQLMLSALSPLWRPKLRVFEGNRVITVPKNAKTDRVIAVEPSLNLFFQKGVGAMIRQRLSRWNVDLTDQGINQRLARRGSWDNSLATVDFSMASDTISYILIAQIIPPGWFDVLDVLRSPRGLVGDTLIEYEKFSSMGNGFTFELESLVFFAVALAVCDEMDVDSSSVSVFGDDVIIPTSCFDRYAEVCKYLGFSVNQKKSYSSTYFRESCGGYFWHGVDIRPVRWLDGCGTETSAISFHNRLHEYDSNECFSPIFTGVRRLLTSSYPRSPIVPPSYGDTGFRSASAPPGSYSVSSGLYRFSVLVWKSAKEPADGQALLLERLWSIRGDDLPFGELIIDSPTGTDVIRPDCQSNGNWADIPRRGSYCRRRQAIPVWC